MHALEKSENLIAFKKSYVLVDNLIKIASVKYSLEILCNSSLVSFTDILFLYLAFLSLFFYFTFSHSSRMSSSLKF